MRVGNEPMEYLKEELLCEAVLVPGFGTLQAVQVSCSFFLVSSDACICCFMLSLSLDAHLHLRSESLRDSM